MFNYVSMREQLSVHFNQCLFLQHLRYAPRKTHRAMIVRKYKQSYLFRLSLNVVDDWVMGQIDISP